MKLIHKLLFPVLFLSLMAVSAIGVGLWGLASTDDAARRAAAKLSDTHITAEVRSISRAVQRDALNLIFEPTDSGRQSIGARFDARLQQLDAALTRLPSQTAFC
jgi:methyl-accepting chemotaxis protein